MYAFFQEHLKNPGSSEDEDIKLLTSEELKVTATGQVSTSLGGETVFSLNAREAEKLSASLDVRRKDPGKFLPEAVNSARKLSGYSEPSGTEDPVFTGRIVKDNYVIEKYFIRGEGKYVIPYLLFKPANPSARTMIYLHPAGKSIEASAGGEIEKFVSEGFTVLAPDLVGTGELGPGALRGDAYFKGVSHNLWYASMLIGRSIAGIQAGDVCRLADMVKASNPGTSVIGFARKEMVPVLLHYAAISRNSDQVIIDDSYGSYLSIIRNRFYDPQLVMSGVPGALREYDLPDLALSLKPGTLKIVPSFNK